jgi:hypothetical protein
MYTIYCIKDINDLKYVGSTKQKLNRRLLIHKNDKKINNYCSSSKLDLDNCEIYSLETDVIKKDKKERERYWINKIDCVNEKKLNGRNMDHRKVQRKEWRDTNRDKLNQYMKQWHKNNKDEINLFRRRSFVNACYEFIKMLEEY